MKEKTFKDLGLDEGDKYLEKIGEEYNLDDLNDILEDSEDKEEMKEKIKDINKKV